MPSCGAPPAWLARPRKRICLTSAPFDESAINERLVIWSCEPAWIIIAMSMSSKWPLATSSGLPSRNSISRAGQRLRHLAEDVDAPVLRLRQRDAHDLLGD